MKRQNKNPRFAICINNGGYVDDLKVRTVYQVLPDDSAARSNYLRIIDETGEDYLYPAGYFMPVELPNELTQLFEQSLSHIKSNGKKKKAKRQSVRERLITA
jgi:hypothetical protein